MRRLSRIGSGGNGQVRRFRRRLLVQARRYRRGSQPGSEEHPVGGAGAGGAVFLQAYVCCGTTHDCMHTHSQGLEEERQGGSVPPPIVGLTWICQEVPELHPVEQVGTGGGGGGLRASQDLPASP